MLSLPVSPLYSTLRAPSACPLAMTHMAYAVVMNHMAKAKAAAPPGPAWLAKAQKLAKSDPIFATPEKRPRLAWTADPAVAGDVAHPEASSSGQSPIQSLMAQSSPTVEAKRAKDEATRAMEEVVEAERSGDKDEDEDIERFWAVALDQNAEDRGKDDEEPKKGKKDKKEKKAKKEKKRARREAAAAVTGAAVEQWGVRMREKGLLPRPHLAEEVVDAAQVRFACPKGRRVAWGGGKVGQTVYKRGQALELQVVFEAQETAGQKFVWAKRLRPGNLARARGGQGQPVGGRSVPSLGGSTPRQPSPGRSRTLAHRRQWVSYDVS